MTLPTFPILFGGPPPPPFAGWGQSLEDCFREEREAQSRQGRADHLPGPCSAPQGQKSRKAGEEPPCHWELVILGSRQEVRCDPYLGVSIRGELASLVS